MGRPRTVVCYICQREFGTASIGIHEKQCLKKWHDENNKLPPSQRRPEPVKPQGFGNFSDPGGGSGAAEQAIKTTGVDPNLDAYNAAASKAAQSNLVACKKCGRRFAADRVNLHEKYCHPPKARKPVYEARKPDFDLNILRQPLKTGQGGPPRAGSPPSRQPTPGPSSPASSSNGFPRCRYCNRTYAPDRIERHEANCHAPPLKKQTSGADRTADGTGRRAREPKQAVEGATGPAICQNCSENLPENAKFCPNCGTPCEKKCRNCAQVLSPGAKFCSKCGKPVQANRNNHIRKDSSKTQSIESAKSVAQVCNEPTKRTSNRPFVICYICGREYGTMSIGIHEPQCLTKWSIQNSRLPANQRLKAPVRPIIGANRDGSDELRNYNRAALSTSARNSGIKNSQEIPALFCVKKCTLK
ncbi:unnamed protein product [Schistocephalus solidus]|uniref:Zinc finger protein 474 n=1 Tax=Schistocephalus solidus TaxID=70667 RepID=A0A183T023_SCHSO|nr:unnamed protein product [Schistocephalus solidus]